MQQVDGVPATHVLEVRAPHLSFIFLKEYWFRELYLGLKVTASFDRSESHTRVIDGQVRCITPEIKPQNLQVIWNVQFITVFVPASSLSAPPGSKISRFPRTHTANGPRAAPTTTWPQNWSLKRRRYRWKNNQNSQHWVLLASRGLLTPDTWKCKQAQVSLKATIDVPMLARSSSKMVMGFLRIPTCQWDGRYTSMAPSDNVVFIDLQLFKSLTIC